MTRSRYSITIDASSWAQLINLAEIAAPFETGGILLGYRLGRTIAVVGVAEVLDPAASTAAYTLRTIEAQTVLDDARRHFPPESPVGYVGDWHTHPGRALPSHVDRRSVATLGSHYRKPMVGLVAVRNRSGWTPHGQLAVRSRARSCPVEVLRESERT